MATWKIVPGFSQYEVSDTGDVRNRSSYLVYSPLRTPNGYNLVAIKNDAGKTVRTGIHRLVCRTFNGPPPDQHHRVVNHKNGIKDDNRAPNLEWSTYQKNTEHAIETGLVTNTSHVDVKNIVTGEVLNFKSVSAAARYFNIADYRVRLHCTKGAVEPLFGKFVFTTKKVPKRKSRIGKSVFGVDLSTGKLYVAESVAQMGIIVSLPETRIKTALKRDELLKGFFFWIGSDVDYTTKISRFTQDDVAVSINAYVDQIEYHLYDYESGRWVSFDRLNRIADHLNIDRDSLYCSFNRHGIRLVKGCYIHAGRRPKSAPHVDSEIVKISRLYVPYPVKPVRVTNTVTGEVSYRKSANELRIELGYATSTFGRLLARQALPNLSIEVMPLPTLEIVDDRDRYRSHLANKRICGTT